MLKFDTLNVVVPIVLELIVKVIVTEFVPTVQLVIVIDEDVYDLNYI